MAPHYLITIKDALTHGYKVDVVNGHVIGLMGRPLRGWTDKDHEYPIVTIVTSGPPKRTNKIPIHKIIAYVLWGDAAFQPGIHVRHLDGNPRNCRQNNLALGTPSQNAYDKPYYVRQAMAKKAGSSPKSQPNRIITEDIIRTILDQCVFGPTGRARRGYVAMWANKLGVAKSTVSAVIKNGKIAKC